MGVTANSGVDAAVESVDHVALGDNEVGVSVQGRGVLEVGLIGSVFLRDVVGRTRTPQVVPVFTRSLGDAGTGVGASAFTVGAAPQPVTPCCVPNGIGHSTGVDLGTGIGAHKCHYG